VHEGRPPFCSEHSAEELPFACSAAGGWHPCSATLTRWKLCVCVCVGKDQILILPGLWQVIMWLTIAPSCSVMEGRVSLLISSVDIARRRVEQ